MSEFTDYLHEVFELFGPIHIRRMFGGHGIFRDGLMFALVFDGTVYLKTDRQNVDHFLKEGLEPFEYITRGKAVKMSYYQAPEDFLEDREQAAQWANLAWEAALRNRKT